jgi:hypothetical protein
MAWVLRLVKLNFVIPMNWSWFFSLLQVHPKISCLTTFKMSYLKLSRGKTVWKAISSTKIFMNKFNARSTSCWCIVIHLVFLFWFICHMCYCCVISSLHIPRALIVEGHFLHPSTIIHNLLIAPCVFALGIVTSLFFLSILIFSYLQFSLSFHNHPHLANCSVHFFSSPCPCWHLLKDVSRK